MAPARKCIARLQTIYRPFPYAAAIATAFHYRLSVSRRHGFKNSESAILCSWLVDYSAHMLLFICECDIHYAILLIKTSEYTSYAPIDVAKPKPMMFVTEQ